MKWQNISNTNLNCNGMVIIIIGMLMLVIILKVIKQVKEIIK